MQKLTLPFLRNSIGSVLVFSLVFGVVLSVMAVGGLKLISGGSDMHKRDIDIIKSYWAAEGGRCVAMRYITCSTPLPGADMGPTSLAALSCNGYTPYVSIALGSADSSYVCKCSVSTASGVKNIVSDSTSATNMSRYTYFTGDDKSGDVTWTWSIVNGDIHTNGYYVIGQAMTAVPHVTGKITTGKRIDATYEYDRPNFAEAYRRGIMIKDRDYNIPEPSVGWLKTRFPDYSFTGYIDPFMITPDTFATHPGYTEIPSTIDHDSIAIRLDNSTAKVYRRSKSTSTWSWYTDYTANNKVLKTTKPTIVGGTLNGQLTIVTDDGNKMIVGDDIFYADNSPTSDDILALVSGDTLEIADTCCSTTTGLISKFRRHGATINASIFVPGDGIHIKNLASYTSAKNMNINGGVFVMTDFPMLSGGNGMVIYCNQDTRFLTNKVIAPGIPFVQIIDPERTSGSTNVYMWALNEGKWENIVSR